jgi:SPOR domain
MDQNSTGGTDKRNWRERLGIGTKDNPVVAKDLPKVAGEFKGTIMPDAPNPNQTSAKTAPAVVKPAPMAPRPAAKPVAAAPAPVAARPVAPPVPRPAPTSPDALANKLKSQRDAAEKLAIQRVAAAKQRAEAAMPAQAQVNGGIEKPKFTFADDDTKSAAPAQPPNRPVPPVQRPAPQNGYSNQIAPPRPQLGGGQALPPRPASPVPQQTYPQSPAYPQGQPYYPPQTPQYPKGYQPPPQGYAQVPPPAYRPIDPATGYAPQPNYNPQLRQPYPSATGPIPPRLQVPQQRSPAAGFNPPASAFGSEGARSLRPNLTPPFRPAAGVAQAEGDEDDIFEQPAPRPTRRATADEYSQAYREVETGYEEEQTRSYTPLILLSLIGLAVVAGLLGWWGYNNYIKNGGKLAGSQTEVPVVAAPVKPAKAAPDATATDNAAAGKAANSSKKLIYDRIVGDREIPGGQMVPSEETPVQPLNNVTPAEPAAPVAPAADTVPAPSAGTGNDGTPLPLPPPPGGAAAPQGALDPSGKNDIVKTAETIITPAAGAQSPAADALPVTPGTQIVSKSTDVVNAAASAPAGSEVITAKVETPKPAAAVPETKPLDEAITDTPPEPTVTAQNKKIIPKATQPKKTSTAEKSLGSKPVVLVPPSKIARQNSAPVKTKNPSAISSEDNGLYGNSELGQGTQVAEAEVPAVAAPQKRKTLLDLFKTDSATVAPSANAPEVTAPASSVQPTQQVATVAPKVAAPTPVSATGAYVAQLASFKSKSEATAEYSRLVAKHGEIIKRYAPIIEQAEVAGSTRYRLNIGPMATSNVASSLCSSLFAAGERDCLVHKQ